MYSQVPGGYNENFACVDLVGSDGVKLMNCPYTVKRRSNDFALNYVNPLKRTTVSIPNNGFTIVRFKADNPGLWLFHSHLFSHLRKGQAMVFDVTDKGLPAVPPNMPTCPIQGAEKRKANADLIELKSIGVPTPELRGDSLVITSLVVIVSLIF